MKKILLLSIILLCTSCEKEKIVKIEKPVSVEQQKKNNQEWDNMMKNDFIIEDKMQKLYDSLDFDEQSALNIIVKEKNGYIDPEDYPPNEE